MIRANVVLAVTKRNFSSYFSSVLGYLFMVVFCVAASAMAFNSQFFAANQANLDQLSSQFPLLLLFLIPAITMTTWSDERKLGTDEILFTMPATEVEILIGKYLSVLCVYTVAILFSLVNVMLLSLMGSPDFGLIISSYVGYWLSGAALLAVGMLASALTSSATVAFVLGVVFCCVPVFIGELAGVVEWMFGVSGQMYEFRTALANLSLSEQLRDFSLGVVPLGSLIYFIGLTALMLYLNLVMISRRRWASSDSAGMGLQFAVRAVCIAVTLGSLLVLSNIWPARADLTSENLFSLTDATYKTISEIEDQQITIQAFVSPEVPSEYSDTRRQLLGLLREFDLRGGSKVDVRRVDVEPFSEEAEEARALGVNPVRIQYEQDGKFEEAEVFLGAIVQSTTDTVEIPFFGKGLPIEYELTRSVRTVSQKDRLTIGVLQTDANVIADSPSGRSWEIVNELRKQYKVIAVNPSRKILAEKKEGEDESDDEPAEDFDVLLAIMPSALTQPQMDNLMEYVEAGRPTLVFDDPCPIFAQGQMGLTMAPKLSKPSPGGGGMMMQRQQPEQKADNGELTSLMRFIGVKWDNGQAVYDRMNPHSQFQSLPPEYVFVSRTGNPKQAFSSASPITGGLQDIVCLYPGTVQERDSEGKEFTALLQTSGESGLLQWDDYIAQSFSPFTMSPTAQIKPNPNRFDDDYAHVIAAHVTSDDDDKPVNVIFCSDIDMISDWFFMERNRGNLDIAFDNVTFILNAVDSLAKEDSFIALRSRRAKLRTLSYVEEQTRELRKRLNDEEEEADKLMNEKLDEARKELQAEVDKVKERTDLDPRSKDVELRKKEEQLNRKLDRDEQELEQEKNAKIRRAGLDMKREIRRIEGRVTMFAWIIPAILPICFGLLFLGLRNMSEKNAIVPERRKR